MRRLRQLLMFVGLVTLTAVAVVWFRLDAIAQSSLEDSLTRVLGVPAQVSALSINKLAGTAEIERLLIQNPDGYSEKDIFQVQTIDVEFSPRSLFQQTLKIQTLKLDRISVNFEQRLRDNNILEIINHVQSSKTRDRNAQSGAVHPRNSGIVSAQISFSQKRFEIETVDLDDISVRAKFSPLSGLIPLEGFSQAVEVTIPDISLANVNTENAELVLEGTLEDVVASLVGDLAGGIFQEVPKQMESDEAKSLINDLIKQLPL